jgi:hypothetical protein
MLEFYWNSLTPACNLGFYCENPVYNETSYSVIFFIKVAPIQYFLQEIDHLMNYTPVIFNIQYKCRVVSTN